MRNRYCLCQFIVQHLGLGQAETREAHSGDWDPSTWATFRHFPRCIGGSWTGSVANTTHWSVSISEAQIVALSYVGHTVAKSTGIPIN